MRIGQPVRPNIPLHPQTLTGSLWAERTVEPRDRWGRESHAPRYVCSDRLLFGCLGRWLPDVRASLRLLRPDVHGRELPTVRFLRPSGLDPQSAVADGRRSAGPSDLGRSRANGSDPRGGLAGGRRETDAAGHHEAGAGCVAGVAASGFHAAARDTAIAPCCCQRACESKKNGKNAPPVMAAKPQATHGILWLDSTLSD